MTKTIYVLDTSTVFNLGHRGRLESLARHLSAEASLWITPQVRREISQPQSLQYFQEHLEPLIEEHKPAGGKLSPSQIAHLEEIIPGAEISVMMVAAENDAVASLDERLARKEAKALGIHCTGTLGLLRLGLERGWMSDDECLKAVLRMRAGNFRISAPGANDDFLSYVARFS